MQAVNEALNGAIRGGQYDRAQPLGRASNALRSRKSTRPARRLERAMTQDTFIQTLPTDPLIAPVIEGLFGEYRRRYGDYFATVNRNRWICTRRRRAFIVLLRAGAPIAMGAFKRYDAQNRRAEAHLDAGRSASPWPGTAGVAAARNAGAGAGISPALSDHRLSPARKRWACI